jgi:DNA repair protein RecN (Recombination protein N)
MNIHKISIRNILGVEHVEFTPARGVTRITGANGAGKTSIVEALKSVVRGGHDATLLRAGQKEGEVVIEFDGGILEQRVRANGTTRKIKQGGVEQRKPAEAIARLWDGVSANPVEFVTAKPARRLDMLLEVVDAAPVVAEVERLTGEKAPGGGSALDVIAAARKAAYDARTEANRAAKIARNHAEVISADLTDESPEDIGVRAAAANAKARDLRTALASAIDAAKAGAEGALSDARRVMDEAIAAARAAYEETAALIQQAKDEAIAAERERYDGQIETAVAEAERLAEVERAAIAAAGRRKLLGELNEQATKLEAESESLTKTIAALDGLKQRTLDSLDIPGVTVEDGNIHYGGIPFERLNTATQWALAIKLARLRAGELPLICCDGLEALDDENWSAFTAAAAAADPPLYFIVTDRGEGPLTVDLEARR